MNDDDLRLQAQIILGVISGEDAIARCRHYAPEIRP